VISFWTHRTVFRFNDSFSVQVRYIGDYMNIIQKSNLNAQNIWSYMDMKKWLLASSFRHSHFKMDDYCDSMICWNQGWADGIQSLRIQIPSKFPFIAKLFIHQFLIFSNKQLINVRSEYPESRSPTRGPPSTVNTLSPRTGTEVITDTTVRTDSSFIEMFSIYRMNRKE